MWRWSFDDMNIGRIYDGESSLRTREIDRPNGLGLREWYQFAQHVCAVLDYAAKPEAT